MKAVRYYYNNIDDSAITEREAKEYSAKIGKSFEAFLEDDLSELPEMFFQHKIYLENMADFHAKAVIKNAWFVNSPEAPELELADQLKCRDEETSAEHEIKGFIKALKIEFNDEYADLLKKIESDAFKNGLKKYRSYNKWSIKKRKDDINANDRS